MKDKNKKGRKADKKTNAPETLELQLAALPSNTKRLLKLLAQANKETQIVRALRQCEEPPETIDLKALRKQLKGFKGRFRLCLSFDPE